MMPDKFNDRLQAEAIRHIQENEAYAELSLREPAHTSGQGLEQHVLDRARQMGEGVALRPRLQKTAEAAKKVAFAAMALLFCLGALAARQAFDGAQQGSVNFFWLLLALLGVNTLMLALWAGGMALASRKAKTGMLGQTLEWTVAYWMARLGGKNGADAAAAQAWFAVMNAGALGRWNLSRLSHALWLSYLLGGSTMILLMLAARQYDFIWETTILSESSFQALTQGLAVLPQWLGFSSPTSEQIAASRIGGSPADAEAARQAWSGLLLGAMLTYGIIPRLLLLAASWVAYGRARAAFRLNLARPYYVRLKQRLIPATRVLGVVDADDGARPQTGPEPQQAREETPPTQSYWLGVELDNAHMAAGESVPVAFNLGNVLDREGQHTALQRAQTLKQAPLVAAVSLQRSPDRGLKRFLAQLTEGRKSLTWLELCETAGYFDQDEQGRDIRICDWHQLAAECGIEPQRVVHRVIGTHSEGEMKHG
ncbi:DUF2868 domain-containing protein [Hahella aquimaris]|uniref:DUF2868 domain-containing protein n=1 Tax=Hahella sp. HNIBRBA332 TaxID=3015983 RepID=UPI00273AABAC|nr:DUF2868 domain-containing protein [Hahella sp. HNIBRBA332]WLQ15910.1 DUF2868 domain-containing protein [Hahella sp. HNIBRBA332]